MPCRSISWPSCHGYYTHRRLGAGGIADAVLAQEVIER